MWTTGKFMKIVVTFVLLLFLPLVKVSKQETQIISARVAHLSGKLDYDRDIQNNVNNIGIKASEAASFFMSTMANQGSQVLAQKSSLMTTLSPNDDRIKTMESTLTAVIKALASNKQQVINLGTDIHSNIEKCRSRKMQHETELKDKESKLHNLQSEIESLGVSISAHDEEASTIENGASTLDRRANEMREAARRKRRRAGLGGIIGGIVGIVFVPLTAGGSLALATAAAGINAGINLNDADDCERNARRLRKEAEDKRETAQSLRTTKASLSSKISSLKSEMKQLSYSAENLGEAAEVLQELVYLLQLSIKDVDTALNVIQGMETVFNEASLHTDSYKIIQGAFAVQPDKLEARAQVYLNQLKEKWTNVETVLLKYSAKSIN